MIRRKLVFVLIIILILVASISFRLYLNRQNVTLEEGLELEVAPAVTLSEEGLPESFPKDFPVVADAKLTDTGHAESGDVEGISVVYETQTSVSEVMLYYQEELKRLGWEVKRIGEEDSQILSFGKDNISGFVGVTEETDGKTVISVTMGIE